jgi:hypothetical protein
MQDVAVSPLTDWESFYVIVGPAAAVLMGLMFVAITLIAGSHVRSADGALAAYGTPNIIHFGAALLVSAILSVPWPALAPAAILLGLAGLVGVGYVAIVVRRLRRPMVYTPVLEDWLWHGAFPLVAYIALLVAALLLPGNPTPALFGIGAVSILLVFIGIHNAWDAVTSLVTGLLPERDKPKDQG